MTNISEDRRVVLAPVREVPEEITFMLSDAEQDPNIPNRYWFDFPNQWINQPNKDPIIGIRDIYLTKTNRFIKYNYKITLNDITQQPSDITTVYEPIDTIEGTIIHWLDGSDTIRPITENFNLYWKSDGIRTHTCTDELHTWKDWEIQAYYGYDRETQKTNLYFGRGILEDPYYTHESSNVEYHYPYGIEITPISDDAKALFGTNETIKAEPDQTKPCRVAIPMWSRYQCLVKSSIATNDKNNILGHTRNDPYTPIKYYRLTSDMKKFWIELYETRFHDCGVVFPKKVYESNENEKKKIDRDDLFIEAIVCFNAQAMI